MRRLGRDLCSLALLIFVVTGLSCRASRHWNVPGDPDYSNWVMADFRDAVYYPVVSLLEGGNPYDREAHLERYPVRDGFPPYTPLVLSIHLPFGLLSHGTAQLLYFAMTIALTLVLAGVTLRMCGLQPGISSVSILAAMILASRPGHWNLLLGQTTIELVLAVYVAFYFGATKPLSSGLALSVATFKAPFGIPLILLMLSERLFRSLRVGLGIAAVGTLIPAAVLVHSAGGLTAFLRSLWNGYLLKASESVVSPVRLDAVALFSRFLGKPLGMCTEVMVLFGVVFVASLAVRRARLRTSGRETTLYCMSVSTIAILVASYHLSYSALLLVLPLTGLVIDRWAPAELGASQFVRFTLIALLLVPAVNYAASFSFLSRYQTDSAAWLLVASVNGFALLFAFGIYTTQAFRDSPTGTSAPRPG